MFGYWQWIIIVVALACGVLLGAGSMYQRRSDRHDRVQNPAPGRLIEVGGRRMHLWCKGQQGPTIVIEQGAGEPARLWWPIQDRVAEFARVCTYDRAGYGWSDAVAGGRSIDERVDDLHAVLKKAGEAAPFLFVAHSYGGLMVRRFAQRFPDLVGGLVLIDSPEEAVLFRPAILKFHSRMGIVLRVAGIAARFGLLRLLAARYSLDGVGLVFVRPGEYATALDDIASLEKVPVAMRNSGGFGALEHRPLAVITHGQAFPGPFAILDEGWADGQARLAALSTRGRLIVAKNSNHMIQHDEPDVVVDAIRSVHASLRESTATTRDSAAR